MKLEVNIEKKHFFILASLLTATLLVACVNAYNSGSPTAMGHTWNEIAGIPEGFADGVDNLGIASESDPTIPANLKDGVNWPEIIDVPAGFADGTDDGCNWNGWKESNKVVTASGVICNGGNNVCSWSVSISLYCSNRIITDFKVNSYPTSTRYR